MNFWGKSIFMVVLVLKKSSSFNLVLKKSWIQLRSWKKTLKNRQKSWKSAEEVLEVLKKYIALVKNIVFFFPNFKESGQLLKISTKTEISKKKLTINDKIRES